MRILVVSSFLPFPLHSGGHVRLYNLIKELSGKHKITLVCEKRDHQTEKDVLELKKLCETVVTFPRKKQWSKENILKSGFSKYPFLLIGHTLPKMKQAIVKLLMEKRFDVIHVETSYVFQNLPKTYIPVVLVEHNIEYKVYERFMNTSKVFLKPLLYIDIQKLKYWEEKFWHFATKLVAVSEEEKKQMGREDVVVVPNGVDLNRFKIHDSRFKKDKKTKKILFIGDFKWIQNRNTLEFILKEIWPNLDSRFMIQDSRVKLWVVGKNIPQVLKELGDKDVIFDENAPDATEKIYEKADILLAPIFVGGGTSYKILESMASGVPVVTTSLGIEGIGGKHGQHALIGKNAEELTSHVETLLQKNDAYIRLAKNARALIEEKYNWKTIAKKLEDVYVSVAKEI